MKKKILLVLGHNRLTGVNSWAYTFAKEINYGFYDYSVEVLFKKIPEMNYCKKFATFIDEIKKVATIHFEKLNNKNFHTVILSYKTHELMFRNFNTIFVSHGTEDKLYIPNEKHKFHVGISEKTTEFLKADTTINNGILLEEFKSLNFLDNKYPKRALYINRHFNSRELETACVYLNIALTHVADEKITAEYINYFDFVVGYGRSAYEAMSCAKPVLIYGPAYSDGWVKEDKLTRMLKRNCSGWEYKYNFTINELIEEILNFDINDGIVNRKLAEKYLSSIEMVEKFIKIM